MAEVGLVRFARLALDVSRKVLPAQRSKFSKRVFTHHTSLIMESLVALVGFCLVFALNAVQRSSKPAKAYQ